MTEVTVKDMGEPSATPPDLARLKELALKATPGEWTVDGLGKVRCAADDGKGFIADPGDGRYYNSIPRDLALSLANAAFIAATNPKAILALLSEIASLRSQLTAAVQERDEAREDRKRYATDLLAAQGQAAELEGANAEITRSLGEAGGKIALTEHRLEKAEAALSATEEVVKAARELATAVGEHKSSIRHDFSTSTEVARYEMWYRAETLVAALSRLDGGGRS